MTNQTARERWLNAYQLVKAKLISKVFITGQGNLSKKIISAEYMIADLDTFKATIGNLYDNCKDNYGGNVASYIPELAHYSPDNWGVSVCTVDGQRFSFGNTDIPFPIQSCCKPLNYALSLTSKLPSTVHQFVGMEPSGRLFNELCMDKDNKPHNPMVNAGAVMVASLLYSHIKDPQERLDKVMSEYKALAGYGYVGYNEKCYESEKRTASRNYALGYLMKEQNAFPEGTDFEETMKHYFKMCSIEITAESGAVIAGTLANGGFCPVTQQKILKVGSVRCALSLMASCGMYDYSGQFAFKVGLPCKSGVSGVLMLVVPNVMGICLWSPPLDECGNSVRGQQFCEELVTKFSFHHYDTMLTTTTKQDPCMKGTMKQEHNVMIVMLSAAKGDLNRLQRLHEGAVHMDSVDYSGRTALHVASGKGHLEVVRFLVETCKIPHGIKDQWSHTPYDEAKLSNHVDVMAYLAGFGNDEHHV